MTLKKVKGITKNKKLLEILEEIVVQAGIESSNTESFEKKEILVTELETTMKETSGDDTIPIRAIKIAKIVATTKDLLLSLDMALQNANLVFSTPEQPPQADAAYQKRIQMLKLAEQERNYTNLTRNLHNSPSDDATLKSMMYAATIGANMIVAPISIGVLMYFFAGKIFSFVLSDYQPAEEGKLDIHGVIAGVVAGVIMMFIEMILFVIRNHEMDKFVSKKMKRQKNPFGYDKKTAERTFI
jgi:hypothetical protein